MNNKGNETKGNATALDLEVNEVLGLNFELISIRYKTYAVYPPSILTLARMARHVVPIALDGAGNNEVFTTIVDNNKNIIPYLAHAIVGDRYENIAGRIRFWLLCRRFRRARAKELVKALSAVQEINSLNDFFLCAHLMSAVVRTLKPSADEPSQV